jgi:prevent-host-death family protein
MVSITISDAKSRFSELLSRASAGERFVIRRRERDIAVLLSARELEKLERNALAAERLAGALGQNDEILARLSRGEVHPAMAAYGLWRDNPEMESLAAEIREEREKYTARPGADL